MHSATNSVEYMGFDALMKHQQQWLNDINKQLATPSTTGITPAVPKGHTVQKHIPNINPTLTVIGQETLSPIGQRQLYVVNRLGDEVREPSADGSVIVRRPVASKTLLDFAVINDEALLAIVADRLDDRSASDYGTRRTATAAKLVRKALAQVIAESTKPLRKRAQGEPAPTTDDSEETDVKPNISIPGVTVDGLGDA